MQSALPCKNFCLPRGVDRFAAEPMAPIADLVHERLEIADSAIYPALKPLQARYMMTVLQGMAVQGADGASPNQLRRVAQVAPRAWPKR
jgi:hypothetical protein